MHLLIFGASRGLGAALAGGLIGPSDTAWLVSRGKPVARGTWIREDLAERGAGQRVAAALNGAPLDAVIYNSGIWEDSAFSPGYAYEALDDDEQERVLQVNLVSAVTSLNKLLPNLRQSKAPRVLLIGSVNGLENTGAPEVAYNASKFGLRGVAHALRAAWQQYGVAVTVINPGSIGGSGIPHADLVALTRSLLAMSAQTCVKEIDILAMNDRV
jgi:short-subunit dehydrogenase